MPTRLHACLLAFLGLGASLVVTTVWGEDWPQFRGPGGVGWTADTKLPAEWSADKNVAWKVKVPGSAWSCPVVWGDKVFLTTAITENQPRAAAGEGRGESKGEGKTEGERRPGKGGGFGRGGGAPNAVYRWEVQCLDRATGKLLWKQLAIEKKPTIGTHRTNTYASETPVVDGERVYAYFGMTGLYVYDFEGKLVWSKDLGSYSMRNNWGTGSSPAVDSERLFIQCDNEDKSFLVALDKKSGAEVWRQSRDERSSWSTPFLWKNQQRTELVAVGRVVRSYDPATGKVLWEMGGLDGRVAATPVANESMLFVGTGGGQSGAGPLFAIKAGALGDITLKDDQTSSEFVAWRAERSGPSMPSPLLYQGNLYVLDQRGTLACYEAATGKQAYRERVPGARQFAASPWAYDGKIFCLDEEGATHVIQAGSAFKEVATNPVNETCWSSPAIAKGALFLRGAEHLFCIRP